MSCISWRCSGFCPRADSSYLTLISLNNRRHRAVFTVVEEAGDIILYLDRLRCRPIHQVICHNTCLAIAAIVDEAGVGDT
jgi:hypothetical protein